MVGGGIVFVEGSNDGAKVDTETGDFVGVAVGINVGRFVGGNEGGVLGVKVGDRNG